VRYNRKATTVFIKVRAHIRAASCSSPLNAAASASFVRARDEVLVERNAQPTDSAVDPDRPTGRPTDPPAKQRNE